MINFRLNSAQFEQAILERAKRLNIEPGQVLEDEMRLLAELCQHITPPKTKAQGAAAIGGDINKAVLLLSKNDFSKVRPETRERLQRAIRSRDYATIRAMFKNMGRWAQWQVEPFSPGLHTSKRNARGRVRGVQRVATLDSAAYRAYVKQVKAKSGKAKAGWNRSIQALGGTVKQDFAMRHGTGRGGVSITGKGTANVSIKIYNDGIHVPGFQQRVNNALTIRAKNIRARTEKLVEAIASKTPMDAVSLDSVIAGTGGPETVSKAFGAQDKADFVASNSGNIRRRGGKRYTAGAVTPNRFVR